MATEASILMIGMADLFDAKEFSNCRSAGFDQDVVSIRHRESLPEANVLDQSDSPAVVMLRFKGDVTYKQLERLRFHWHGTNVVICAMPAEISDVHKLLAKGADDFVEWPISQEVLMRRLVARVAAFQMRSHQSTRQIGSLVLNMMQRIVTNGQDVAHLTPIETRIVTTLVDSLGTVVQRASMKQTCWGNTKITDNALNRKIYEVRRTLLKLSNEVNIRTIYGLGFELVVGERVAE